MVQVPLPSVSPSSSGVGGVSPRVTDDAFGAGVVAADKQLGRQLESSGDEIFKTAMSMQGQLNDAAAKEADAQYVIKSSDLYANYQTLQGDAAVKARPKFLEDLSKLREEVRGGLGNPAAQRMFDASTRQQFARTVFSTAAHAAQEGRKYTEQASQARVDAAKFQSEQFPDQAGQVKSNLDVVLQETRAQAKQKNLPPEKEEQLVREARSDFITNQAIALARKDPFKAFDMLKANEKAIGSKDYERASRVVIDGKRTVRARMVSDEVMFGIDPDDPKKSLAEAQDEAVAKVEQYLEDDPMLKDAVKDRVAIDWTKRQGAKTLADRAAMNTMNGMLSGLTTPDNKLPTTVEELKATPEGYAAWNRLDETKKKAIMGQLRVNANSATKVTNHEEAMRLQGQASTDPTGFMAEEIGTNSKLSAADQRKFLKLQQDMTKKVEMDPRVRQALMVLGPDMRAAGITNDKKDEYDRFVGTLQDAIMQEQGDAKRPLKPDEYRRIGARLMQEQAAPWYNPGGIFGKTRMYQVDVPEKEKAKITDMFWNRFGIAPTEEQLQREYTRAMYNKAFGKKSAPKDESKPNQPQVPVSE